MKANKVSPTMAFRGEIETAEKKRNEAFQKRLNAKPMLFMQDMVMQILAGNKTMTRREAKNYKLNIFIGDIKSGYTCFTPYSHSYISVRGKWIDENKEERYGESYIKNPYGRPGNLIWVKETFYQRGRWVKNGKSEKGKQKWKFEPVRNQILYFDTLGDRIVRKNSFREIGWYKRPALFMNKKYARLWLEITKISIERLQNISENDGKLEGMLFCDKKTVPNWVVSGGSAKENFKAIWMLKNGISSWENNGFVWVISFKKYENA